MRGLFSCPEGAQHMAFVRVSAPEGEFTIDDGARAVVSGAVTVLDKPAVDRNGRALPPKPRTNKAGQPKVSASPKINEDKES